MRPAEKMAGWPVACLGDLPVETDGAGVAQAHVDVDVVHLRYDRSEPRIHLIAAPTVHCADQYYSSAHL